MTIIYQYLNLNRGAKLIKRPSKSIKSPYIADIFINNKEYLAHCPALGISGLLNHDSNFICSFNNSTTRKSKYTIELAYLPSSKDTTTITNTNPNFGNILFKSIVEKNLIHDYLNHKVI